MANLNAQVEETYTDVADGNQSDNLEVNTGGNGEILTVFVDDGSGGAPANSTLIAERYSEAFDRWMEYGRREITDVTTAQSFTDEAIPDRMRYRVENASGGVATFRLSAASY